MESQAVRRAICGQETVQRYAVEKRDRPTRQTGGAARSETSPGPGKPDTDGV
ncbi:hypothetical protein D3C85_1870470 [compost metagenome]